MRAATVGQLANSLRTGHFGALPGPVARAVPDDRSRSDPAAGEALLPL
ncbi:hypothetical protein PV682_36835 [Streptomyces niveiscabiei]|nr:hypothetical protein [Streptomyces niveiscabiei]MDX3386972.1 hypothetical protein [Streptomyces niveiscabiei]